MPLYKLKSCSLNRTNVIKHTGSGLTRGVNVKVSKNAHANKVAFLIF